MKIVLNLNHPAIRSIYEVTYVLNRGLQQPRFGLSVCIDGFIHDQNGNAVGSWEIASSDNNVVPIRM